MCQRQPHSPGHLGQAKTRRSCSACALADDAKWPWIKKNDSGCQKWHPTIDYIDYIAYIDYIGSMPYIYTYIYILLYVYVFSLRWMGQILSNINS